MRRALVVTVVHHPDDARIRHREIAALLDAGWQVTYAAAFSDHGVSLPTGTAHLSAVDLPRASGRRRFAAFRAARLLLRTRARHHDVVLLHDPELLLALPGLDLPPVAWDVHEDTRAAMTLKPWLPIVLRTLASTAVGLLERIAARHVHVLLAEESYRDRFDRAAVVVPNAVRVPDRVAPPGDEIVVYLGHVTAARGAVELVSVGQQLAETGRGVPRLLVIGPADESARRILGPAVDAGYLTWSGFVSSDHALGTLSGALAGLSLLHDEPNYRASMPTKVIEYMAYGVPVITTPLPLARALVQRASCGVVVPFGDPDAVVREINRLRDDPVERTRMGSAGHRVAGAEFDWRRIASRFVGKMEHIARPEQTPAPGRSAGSGAK